MYCFKPVLALILMTLFISGCELQSDKKTLRMGHTLDTKHSVHQAMVYMAERLNYYSQGSMELKIYPGGQLGSEREMVELLQIGSLAMTKVSAAAMEGFVPEMKVFSLPYIFRSRAHRWQVLESEIGQEILDATQKAHLVGLGYFDAGSRSFYMTDGQVYSPKDIISKKIRVMNSQIAVKMIAAFGGAATPISWGELYAALQQGVVDGAENNPPSYYSSRHFEIAKFYSLNEHTSVPDVIVASEHIVESLTSQQQKWLKLATADAIERQKSLWLAAENEALSAVKEAGVSINYPDKTPFFEAVEPFHATYDNTMIGNYLTRIKSLTLAVEGENE